MKNEKNEDLALLDKVLFPLYCVLRDAHAWQIPDAKDETCFASVKIF